MHRCDNIAFMALITLHGCARSIAVGFDITVFVVDINITKSGDLSA